MTTIARKKSGIPTRSAFGELKYQFRDFAKDARAYLQELTAGPGFYLFLLCVGSGLTSTAMLFLK